MLRRLPALHTARRTFSLQVPSRQNSNDVIDDLGVPLRATWSVEKLLSTYPAPQISNNTLVRLHRLAALNPPDPGTPAAKSLRLELQELLRLVEAVKLVDTVRGTEIPDSRIWREDRGVDVDAPHANHLDEARGEALLNHAIKHVDGQYLVETAPRSRGSAKAE